MIGRLRVQTRGFLAWFCGSGLLLFQALGARASTPGGDAQLWRLKREVLTNYTVITAMAYQDTYATARQLQSAIQAMLREPSEASLAVARRAWLTAHRTYSLTEACRFYDGPIDQVEALVNSWPIDDRYIDSVPDDPAAGIINHLEQYPELNRELIVALNEKDGKKNISTGFHAIEFLLWGEPPRTGGPGTRSWRDYAQNARNVERRRLYLRLITDLLVEHLQTVCAAWTTNAANYRAQFLALDTDVALANVLKGLGALSGPELSGERLTSAYETKEREEQQDCFSDNSCDDLVADVLGIQNVFLGRYTRVDGCQISGPGPAEFLARVDPVFANKLSAQISLALEAAGNIPAPFDQAILGTNSSPGRRALKRAIVALQTQSDLIAEAAKVLAIQLNL